MIQHLFLRKTNFTAMRPIVPTVRTEIYFCFNFLLMHRLRCLDRTCTACTTIESMRPILYRSCNKTIPNPTTVLYTRLFSSIPPSRTTIASATSSSTLRNQHRSFFVPSPVFWPSLIRSLSLPSLFAHPWWLRPDDDRRDCFWRRNYESAFLRMTVVTLKL